MALACRVCGAPFRPDDVDHERQLARCAHCDTLADLQGPTRARPTVPLPEAFTVQQDPLRLQIGWVWRRPTHLFLAVFAVAWNAFLVLWFGFSLVVGPFAILLWLAASLHVLVGLVITWRAAAGLLNCTTITVDAAELTIRHGPVPWRGNLRAPTQQIQQFYVKQHTSHSKHGAVRHRYELRAIVDGRDTPVLPAFGDALNAIWLEQQLEGRLRLVDAPVVGEHHPDQA